MAKDGIYTICTFAQFKWSNVEFFHVRPFLVVECGTFPHSPTLFPRSPLFSGRMWNFSTFAHFVSTFAHFSNPISTFAQKFHIQVISTFLTHVNSTFNTC